MQPLYKIMCSEFVFCESGGVGRFCWTDLSGCVTELKFDRLAIHSYNRCRREQIQFDILPLLSQTALLGHTQ